MQAIQWGSEKYDAFVVSSIDRAFVLPPLWTLRIKIAILIKRSLRYGVLIYSTLGSICAKYRSFWTGMRSGGVSCLVSKYEMKDCALTTLHKPGIIFQKFKIFSSSLRYVTKPYQLCKWHGTRKCYMAVITVFTIHNHSINNAVDSGYLNKAIINHLANVHTQTKLTLIRCLCVTLSGRI
jgi:hypothetical protein